MNEKPNPKTALADLYRAARLAPLSADVHEALAVCAQVLSEAIKPATPAAE